MNILKKNQIIIYTFALMLVAAGYLNYTSTLGKKDVETSVEEIVNEENQIADIGDAKLVNSDDVVSQNNNSNNDNNIGNSDNNSNNISDNSNNDSTKASSISTEENLSDKSNKSKETSADINSDDYFIQSKLERDTMYSQMIENYEKILNSDNSLETRKTNCYTRNFKNK